MPSSSHTANPHIASLIRLACEESRAAREPYRIRNRYTA